MATLPEKIIYLERYHTQLTLCRIIKQVFKVKGQRIKSFPRYLRLIKEGKRTGKKYESVISYMYTIARGKLSSRDFLSIDDFINELKSLKVDFVCYPNVSPPYYFWQRKTTVFTETLKKPEWKLKKFQRAGIYFIIVYPASGNKKPYYKLLARSLKWASNKNIAYLWYFITEIFVQFLIREFKYQDFKFYKLVGIDFKTQIRK